jgi:hypothetical protein
VKFKIKGLADSVSGENLLHSRGLLTVFSHGGRDKAALQGLFYKTTNIIYESSTLKT